MRAHPDPHIEAAPGPFWAPESWHHRWSWAHSLLPQGLKPLSLWGLPRGHQLEVGRELCCKKDESPNRGLTWEGAWLHPGFTGKPIVWNRNLFLNKADLAEKGSLTVSAPKFYYIWALGNCIYTHVNLPYIICKLRSKSMQIEGRVI